jgi:hypothetical protein
MAVVLFGMPGLDVLDGDAETQPPHGEPAQAIEGPRAGKGDAVVPSEAEVTAQQRLL